MQLNAVIRRKNTRSLSQLCGEEVIANKGGSQMDKAIFIAEFEIDNDKHNTGNH